MATGTISKRTVDAAKPGAKDWFLWDDATPGFGLKVTPAGGKVYLFQYRIARPGEAARTPMKRYTIGKHGKVTPDNAFSGLPAASGDGRFARQTVDNCFDRSRLGTRVACSEMANFRQSRCWG